MVDLLFLDTETYCDTPIKNGTYRYAEDAEVMVFAYAENAEQPCVIDMTAGEVIPEHIVRKMTDPSVLKVFHNSMFDRTVIRFGLGIDIPVEQIHDTMVQALAHSLPGALASLCDIMKVDAEEVKDSRGKTLIKMFCVPKPKNQKIRRFTRETHPQEWQEFLHYAGTDITAMRSIFNKMPRWNYSGRELDLWRLDQRINDRGFAVDRHLAHSALEAIAKAQIRFRDRTFDETLGIVGSPLQRDRFLKFIVGAYGVDLPDFTKSTIERRLQDESLPKEAKELLALRLEASKSSTSKYNALLKAINDDDRMRGGLQFCGASRTGRWAGRTFQPQNLFRPTMKAESIEEGIARLKRGEVGANDKVMELCANAIRGTIVAPKGYKLVISDLSNIEGRFAAWIAGEAWKCEAFSQYDRGIGDDLYKVAYAKAFAISPKDVDGGAKSGPQRQIGKVMELMLQYEGGVGAFLTGAMTYRIDLDEMSKTALPNIPERIREESLAFWQWTVKKKRSTFDLDRDTFIACDALKRLWREAHPGISTIWNELKEAFSLSVLNPGKVFTVRKLHFVKQGPWLRIKLPSGRCLCYPSPEVNEKGEISYMGINSYTRKWMRLKTYGGKLFENCLTAETKILTHNGIKCIVDVSSDDKIWDGLSWVNHEGVVCQGMRDIIQFGGVGITKEHKVLVNEKWAEAGTIDYEAAASSCERYYRGTQRVFRSLELRRQRRDQIAMGRTVSWLWQKDFTSCNRVYEEETKIMRVPKVGTNREKEYAAQHERNPYLCRIPQYVREVPQPETSCVAQLWWTGYRSVRGLAKFFQAILRRYGANIRAWAFDRENKQRFRVFETKLSLGDHERTSTQYASPKVNSHAARLDSVMARSGDFRDRPYHSFVSRECRRPPIHAVQPDTTQELVYDIVNAGPNHRFTVQGADGRFIIVHNCVQAGARDVMAHNMPRVEDDGFQIILTVHDELITQAPDLDEFSDERLSGLLSAVPPWAEGLPLAAGGFEALRYKKE